ncbi:39S ribosomal protein L44, mitochondrial [Maublancomyces gigas]|uniref:Large ribosomal subunit protein mL53 n=1 Tax=Discina gigas TaxID=1032678 RepID=A0ABR3GEW1_9PEZI
MIVRYISKVTVAFNPFSPRARTARLFVSLLPPDARMTMRINTVVLPRDSEEGGSVHVVFKDGKEVKLDTSKMGISDVVEECDRHSRTLQRKDALTG